MQLFKTFPIKLCWVKHLQYRYRTTRSLRYLLYTDEAQDKYYSTWSVHVQCKHLCICCWISSTLGAVRSWFPRRQSICVRWMRSLSQCAWTKLLFTAKCSTCIYTHMYQKYTLAITPIPVFFYKFNKVASYNTTYPRYSTLPVYLTKYYTTYCPIHANKRVMYSTYSELSLHLALAYWHTT